jgi:manganese/zinc/iron transport system permease protein
VFFGIGIVLLTYIQQTGNAGQSGLQNFLLGKAAAMSRSDISTMMIIDSIILVVIILFFKEFKILSFDPVFARSTGMPVRFLETILTTLTVLAVAAGIQAVGVVLMAAMLIAPPAAARFWTNDLRRMLILAVLFGIAGGVLGAVVSYSDNRMPTGPWVVTMSSLLVLGSLLFAPGRGIIPRWRIRHQYRIKVRRENVLKLLYHLEEASVPGKGFSPDDMLKRRALDPVELRRTLKELIGKELVNKNELGYLLSAAGRNEARRVVRIHRLWEMYLTEKMNIASDHVHDDAEAMEHIITPEMEDKLARLLNFPARDPHNKQIPWS